MLRYKNHQRKQPDRSESANIGPVLNVPSSRCVRSGRSLGPAAENQTFLISNAKPEEPQVPFLDLNRDNRSEMPRGEPVLGPGQASPIGRAIK